MSNHNFPRFLGSVSGALFAAFSFALIRWSAIVAEERVACTGGELIADRIIPVEGGAVTVELGGQKFLSSKSELCRHVAQMYAREPELGRRLPWNAYVPVVAQMAVGSDVDIARLAVQGVIESSTLSGEEVLTFFRGLTATPAGGALLAGQILQLKSTSVVNRDTVCRALPFLPENQLTPLRERIKSELSWIGVRCLKEVMGYGRRSVSENRIKEGRAAFEVATRIFDQDGEAARTARIALERLRAIEDALASGTAQHVEEALRVAAFDVTIGEGVARLQPRIIQGFMQRAILDNQPGEALRALAYLDFSQRNTSHHELLLKALDRITRRDIDAFREERVGRMMFSYSAKDDLLKRRSLEQLSALLREDVEVAGGRSSDVLMGIVQEIRPDPSEDNDMLRFVIAEARLESGDVAGADQIMGQIHTRLPIVSRCRFFARKNRVALFSFATCASIVIWTLVCIRGRRALPHKIGGGHHNGSEGRQKAARASNESEVEHSLAKSSYTDFDEYGECLSKFSLKKDATLSEIKLAYRNAVKSFHPDLNPRASRTDVDQFIQLTKVYERLIELHRERAQNRQGE